ncbi:MAG: DUF1461 domain-containing protein [Nanoarchaeota archaeon]|nr:DUF1461 domain-containing protein [Nanoarchaeota archaeon]
MKRSVVWLLSLLFLVSSFFLLLGISFFGNAFSQEHYDAAFSRYSVESSTSFSAYSVNEAVVSYVSGSTDALLVDVFTANELSHLGDVRVVIGGARRFVMVNGMVFVLVLLLGIGMKERVVFLRRLLLMSGGISLLFALFVILSILYWFDGLFTLFHGLFFLGGTWQFPATSNLILLYPEAFFVDLGTIIMKTFLLGANFFIVLGGIVLVLEKKWSYKNF